jgi:hypothetical protein
MWQPYFMMESFTKNGWNFFSRVVQGQVFVSIDAIGFPTADAIHALTRFLSPNVVCVTIVPGGLARILGGLAAVRRYAENNPGVCANINFMFVLCLCCIYPCPCFREGMDCYRVIPRQLNEDLWLQQQMPGQQSDCESWSVEEALNRRQVWISRIGDVRWKNIQGLNNALERNPITIYLAEDVRTGLPKAATWFKWIYEYIRFGGSTFDFGATAHLIIYMRLSAWFGYLATVPDSQIQRWIDNTHHEWHVFKNVSRPADPPNFCLPSVVAPGPMPGCDAVSVTLVEGFRRFFQCDKSVEDIPIIVVFEKDFQQRLENFFSAWGSVFSDSEREAITRGVSGANWTLKGVCSYLLSSLRRETVPSDAQLAAMLCVSPPLQASSAQMSGLPPAQTQSPPSSQPAISEGDTYDIDTYAAIANLFQISDLTAVIAEADSLFGWTPEQMTDRLREAVGWQLGDISIRIIREGIFGGNWTLRDIRGLVELRATLSKGVMAAYGLKGIDDLITVSNEVKDVWELLRTLFQGLSAYYVSADLEPTISTEIMIGILPRGVDLCERLIELQFTKKQQPADPVPSISSAKSNQPPTVSPVPLVQKKGTGAEAEMERNEYKRIHVRGDNNCLFNGIGILLALFGVRFPQGLEDLNEVLHILQELLRTGTTTHMLHVIQLAANLQTRLRRGVVDNRLLQLVATAQEDLLEKFGFGPDELAVWRPQYPIVRRATTEENLARVLLDQLQFIAQVYLREMLAQFPLPPLLPEALTDLLAAIQGDIARDNQQRLAHGLFQRPLARTLVEYQRNYTGQIGQWGEIVDVIFIAMYFQLPVYVINRGTIPVFAFDRDGNVIPDPDLHSIPQNAIVFWNNGTGATQGTHWDVYVPRDARVLPMWYATT